MHSLSVKGVVLVLGGVLALSLVALPWAMGPGSSEAQQDMMHNCPQPAGWAISVWDGADGTDTGQALDTCGTGAVAAAYYLDPQTGAWSRWFLGQPGMSTLATLDNWQGVIAFGAAGAPAATPTPAPTPTPIVFQKGDTDTSFHIDSASFQVAWTVEATGVPGLTTTAKIEVFPQGEATAACSFEHSGSGSAAGVCDAGPGDFYVKVSRKEAVGGSITSWRVEITPL